MSGRNDGKKTHKPRAVAIHYDQKAEPAPKIGAGGEGFVAERIIKIAREYDIPFYRDGDLCEVLLKFEADTIIPQELYEAIARVLVFIYKANKDYKTTR